MLLLIPGHHLEKLVASRPQIADAGEKGAVRDVGDASDKAGDARCGRCRLPVGSDHQLLGRRQSAYESRHEHGFALEVDDGRRHFRPLGESLREVFDEFVGFAEKLLGLAGVESLANRIGGSESGIERQVKVKIRVISGRSELVIEKALLGLLIAQKYRGRADAECALDFAIEEQRSKGNLDAAEPFIDDALVNDFGGRSFFL